MKHVRSNLTASGVGSPHIFPVSSLAALSSKQDEDEDTLAESGFPVFEQAISRFAVEELPRLSQRAGYDEITSVRNRISAWADMAAQDETTRERKITELKEAHVQALSTLAALAEHNITRNIARKQRAALSCTAAAGLRDESFFPGIL